nr:uncharacterized protein LOC107444847 isoform X2 [Parasteatoda tepidariorum]
MSLKFRMKYFIYNCDMNKDFRYKDSHNSLMMRKTSPYVLNGKNVCMICGKLFSMKDFNSVFEDPDGHFVHKQTMHYVIDGKHACDACGKMFSNKEKKKFAVVKFSQSEHVEVIPISWLINNEKGKWPPAKKSTVYLRRCIRESAEPENDWQTLDLKVYCLSETLKCANKLAQAAFDASIIETSSSKERANSRKRIRIKPIRFRDDSSEEEEDITKNKCTEVSSILNVNQMSEMNDSAKMLTMMTKMLNHAKDTKDELKHLRNEVKEIKDQQIQFLNKETHDSTYGLLELPRGIVFPLSSDADLIQLEEKLKEDKNLQSALIRYFDCICSGKTVSGFLLSICRKFLTKDLAMQYSRLGRKGKKCFENHSVITNVILVQRRFEENRQVIAEKFGKALAQAVDWDGRPKIIEVTNSLDLETEECVNMF